MTSSSTARSSNPQVLDIELTLCFHFKMTHADSRLFFICRTTEVGDSIPKGLYECRCGNWTEARIGQVNSGKTRSCGCLRKQTAKTRGESNFRHGNSGVNRSTTYRSWQAMLERCTKESSKDYHRYGGSGVHVHPRWTVFKNFLADMGERPPGKTIDRFPDCSGDYGPENSRWATATEQARNKRKMLLFDWNGDHLTIKEILELTGSDVPYNTVYWRTKNGFSIEEAVT